MDVSSSLVADVYHKSFTPLPVGLVSGGGAADGGSNTSLSAGAASLSEPLRATSPPRTRDEAQRVNENLRGHVHMLEDEVRLLRQAVAEPFTTTAAPQQQQQQQQQGQSAGGATGYYYASAAAIAARRRAQIAQLRERTQQLHDARANTAARQTRSASARTPSAPRGRFVAPVELVMVPTSSRTADHNGHHQYGDDGGEADGDGYAQASASSRGGAAVKPEIAFGRRVVPSTARPASAGRRRASPSGGGIPLQGSGRGATILPTPSASLRNSPRRKADEPFSSAAVPVADGGVSGSHPDRHPTDPYYTFLPAYGGSRPGTGHGNARETINNTVSDNVGGTYMVSRPPTMTEHPYLSGFLPPLSRDAWAPTAGGIAVVPPLNPPNTFPDMTEAEIVQEAALTARLRADVALLTHTVDVLRRTLVDRDAFLDRLTEQVEVSRVMRSEAPRNTGPASGRSNNNNNVTIQSSDDAAAATATVRALAEELQRVRRSLLQTEQQLVVVRQQFTQSQLALTRRNEELAAVRGQGQPTAEPTPQVPTTTTTTTASTTTFTTANASAVPPAPLTLATLSVPPPPPVLPPPVSQPPLLSASTHTLDSSVARPAQNAPVSAPNPLGLGPSPAATVNHTAWSSATVTPSLVPLVMPVLTAQTSLSGVPNDADASPPAAPPPPPPHMSQLPTVLPPPAVPGCGASMTLPLNTAAATAAGGVGANTGETVASLEAKLSAVTRKLEAWERWFATQSHAPAPTPKPISTPDAPLTLAREPARAGPVPAYYSAYTVKSRHTANNAAGCVACDRCATLAAAGAPPAKSEVETPSAVLSQTNWDLREDVREAVARDRVLRELATRERAVAEERLTKVMQWRQEVGKESTGERTPPPQKTETVD